LVSIVSKLPVDFELVGYDFGNYKHKTKDIGNITVSQYTPKIAEHYRDWDFFVSCSPAEGFGLSIAEALACGLPCIILDCGGVCRYLTHGKHAYIAKDADDVRRGIQLLVEGKLKLNPLGVDFSSKTMVDSYMSLYRKLTSGDFRKNIVLPKQESDSVTSSGRKKIKVLYHLPFGVVGGAETQVQYLVNSLPDHVIPLITYIEPVTEKFLQTTFRKGSFFRIEGIDNFRSKLKEFDPDVIQFFHNPHFYWLLSQSDYRGKVIEIAHNSINFGGDCSTYPKDRTSMLVCVSSSAQDHYIFKRGRDVPMVIIPNGVDTSIFYPPMTRTKNPRLLGGYCGRLEAVDGKGVASLIQIVSKMPVDFELVGYDLGGFRQKTKELTNIKVLPYTSKIADYYRRWDFFVSCSPKEGFGLAIAEALACGLPSVLFNCGGICSYLENNKHAIISNDYAGVERGIRDLLRGKVLYPTEVDFSSKKMAEAYVDLYEGLLDGSTVEKLKVKEASLPKPPVKKGVTIAVVPQGWNSIRVALEPKVDSICPPDKCLEHTRLRAPEKIIWGGFLPDHLQAIRSLRSITDAHISISYHVTAASNSFEALHRKGLMCAANAVKEGYANSLSTPHEGLAKALSVAYGIEVTYDRNKVELITPPEGIKKLAGLHIGIFGTGLPWKNMDTQYLAAAMTPGLAAIHTQEYSLNSTDMDPSHLDFLKSLKVNHVLHPYQQDRQEYFKLAAKMRINLAVTFSESFGYLGLESFMLGVPAIVGATTPSMRGAKGALRKCIVNYIDDPQAISDAILEVLEDYNNVLQEGIRLCQKLIALG